MIIEADTSLKDSATCKQLNQNQLIPGKKIVSLTVCQDKSGAWLHYCPNTADQHGPTTHGVVLSSRSRFVVAVRSTRKSNEIFTVTAGRGILMGLWVVYLNNRQAKCSTAQDTIVFLKKPGDILQSCIFKPLQTHEMI